MGNLFRLVADVMTATSGPLVVRPAMRLCRAVSGVASQTGYKGYASPALALARFCKNLAPRLSPYAPAHFFEKTAWAKRVGREGCGFGE